jgi:hypothetical protein
MLHASTLTSPSTFPSALLPADIRSCDAAAHNVIFSLLQLGTVRDGILQTTHGECARRSFLRRGPATGGWIGRLFCRIFTFFIWGGRFIWGGVRIPSRAAGGLGVTKKGEEGDQRERGIAREERKGSLEMGCRVLGGLFWAGYAL